MGRRGVSRSLIFAAAAAPLALGGCAMTSTYGTGEAPEVALLREMSGGLLSSKQKPIEYQPRAPLVMPQNDQLPPPSDTAAVTSPDWPVDPKDTAVASAAKDDNPYDDVTVADYQRTRPLAELQPKKKLTPPKNDRMSDRQEYYRLARQGRGEGEAFGKALADSKGYSNSQERRYLTDPPLTYRAPADTAPSGAATGVKKRHFWSFLFSPS